jgi:hypothetical protein
MLATLFKHRRPLVISSYFKSPLTVTALDPMIVTGASVPRATPSRTRLGHRRPPPRAVIIESSIWVTVATLKLWVTVVASEQDIFLNFQVNSLFISFLIVLLGHLDSCHIRHLRYCTSGRMISYVLGRSRCWMSYASAISYITISYIQYSLTGRTILMVSSTSYPHYCNQHSCASSTPPSPRVHFSNFSCATTPCQSPLAPMLHRFAAAAATVQHSSGGGCAQHLLLLPYSAAVAGAVSPHSSGGRHVVAQHSTIFSMLPSSLPNTLEA